jgi:mono/diheme cytochrome c family protein
MQKVCFFALALPALVLALAFPAAAAGDAVSGLKIAQENCARCHNVEKGGPFKLRPPGFQSIAIYRGSDDIWARIIAPSPHSGMPEVQWMLTRRQVEDLVAYIVSLDTPVSLPGQ